MTIIRLATNEDLPHLPTIEAEAALRLKDIGMEALQDAFAQLLTAEAAFDAYAQDGRLWVAIEDERPVGFIIVSIIEGNLHIDEVDVLPAYGRRGIGRALMKTACSWGQSLGLSHATLSTQANVPWNLPYYQKLGFEVMPSVEWTPAYHRIREIEAAAGFPMSERVLMKLTL